MCGIAAVLLHPQSRRAEVWQAIRAAFTRNLISNEARGQSATGVAVVQSSGEAVVYKLPIRASRFVGTEAYRDILSMIGAHTTAVLGHTRMPTQGSSNNPANNHPIEVRPVLGVHNGHVANDAELFARWHLPRQAQVDSEVIFQMLAAVPPTSLNRQYLTPLGEHLAQMERQITFIAVDERCL